MTIVPDQTLVIIIVLIMVLMVILNNVLFKPMLKILNEREARTEGRRSRAKEAQAQADQIWDGYQKSLSAARLEADQSRVALVRQGELERNKIVEVAQAEAEKTTAEIKSSVAADALAARNAVKAQVNALAASMAEKIIGRAI